MAWVKWDQVCRSKDAGGLGIKDWNLFNIALLGKWRWKLTSGCNDFCTKVLRARYGIRNRNGIFDCRPKDSIWWKDLYKTCFEIREDACWFDVNLQLKLGCGNQTSFWRDPWCEGITLKNCFKKLFHLSTQKNCLISDMCSWENGEKIWVFSWRRHLSLRESALVEELQRVIADKPLFEGVMDSRIWTAEPGGAYSVRSAYKSLQKNEGLNKDPIFRLLWIPAAPSNICAFTWKVLLNRIPTRMNLLRRHIMPSSEVANCPVCLEAEESVDHLFILCPYAVKVWTLCYCWLGLQLTLPEICRKHLLQHEFPGFNSFQNGVYRVLWMAVIWSLWIHRNHIIFRDTRSREEEVLEAALLRTWHWISSRVKGCSFSVYDWLSNPIVCIKMLG